MSKRILVTGGAGYIGSHTVVELLQGGDDVLIVDNLSNSSERVLDRIEKITRRRPGFVRADICDRSELQAIFERFHPAAVIHFAGLKAVGESVEKPLDYYHNNLGGSAILLEVMRTAGVKELVFSSSATVYGTPEQLPLREDAPLGATNPYGRTKLFVEELLRDLYASDRSWRIAILRYFNPIGAHASGEIGEDPRDLPNNLFPFITQVAAGRRSELSIFGNDYATVDGTGVRDYIHVVDLALGHIKALQRLAAAPGLVTCNLGTGVGYSVQQLVTTFEQVTGQSIPCRIVPRRPGDIAACWADPSHARSELGWEATRGLEAMCRDGWNWQQKNPQGYGDE